MSRATPDLKLSDLTLPNSEHYEYYHSVFDNEREHAFVICETDDGWMIRVTIRTAGAVSSISQIFTLPDHWQEFLTDLYGEAEDRIVFGDFDA